MKIHSKPELNRRIVVCPEKNAKTVDPVRNLLKNGHCNCIVRGNKREVNDNLVL